MDVVAHQAAAGEPSTDIRRYDVTVRVGNTKYVVLYTPPNGARTVEYSTGMSILVLVRNDKLTFNSRVSGKTEVPILRREEGASQPAIDFSKSPGQYFSMKLQHLSDALDLNDDQQAKIKPVLEQETGEVGQVFANPALSRKDKLERYKKIVRTSDEEIKPVLTETQLQKLEEMRKEQKKEVKRIISEQKSAKQS